MSQADTLGAEGALKTSAFSIHQLDGEACMARIDPPHTTSGESAAEGSAEAQASSLTPPGSNELTADQLRLQALQLAEILRQRQQELDAREASLNSCIACWEAEQRAARLHEIEQEARLAAQYEALKQKQCELDRQAAQLNIRQNELGQQTQALQQREQTLHEREQMLAAQELQVRRRLERLATAEAAQLRSVRQTEECLASATELNELRERLVAEYRSRMAELEKQRKAVERRAADIAKRETALKQLREEMARLHRETLELRLATEELWTRLSGAAPPPELIQSLAQLRSKLAKQYRLANAELAEERKMLETIHQQIAAEHEKLVRRKKDFDLWFTGREQECQKQAERLLACEQKLRRQVLRFRRQSRLWQLEKAHCVFRPHQPRKATASGAQPACRSEELHSA